MCPLLTLLELCWYENVYENHHYNSCILTTVRAIFYCRSSSSFFVVEEEDTSLSGESGPLIKRPGSPVYEQHVT